MAPKLDDVAKLAQVSKTTVSRVLNKRGYLSQATIDKVYAAIKELDYHPNVVARQLYKNKTNLIGILLPTVANPFFGELTAALEMKLYQQGFKVLIGNSMNDPAKETAYLNELLTKQVDGLVVGTHNQGIKQYEHRDLPIVAIDRIMNQDIPIVESDNYRGGVVATTRLIDQGAQHIIHINGPRELATPARRRRDAYEAVMREHGLTPSTYEIDFNLPEGRKKQLFRQLLIDHPEIEGIFSSNDTDAALIMQLAHELGRKIPDELLLIGYDGTKTVRELLPSLTTIVQPIDDLATTAIQVLNDRMQGITTKKEYILPIKLWQGDTA
ncbi:LacI family DNA-binding transcriptional regulator [Lactiplantibacillus dongliensis]|uniref:LacI family DNA-binding transcriptional regulator n=1 Tax=Lactiplantibacillus dongliensis TaxID=2559919 RepID=A0ABW1R846_9LACO|nr:LacI family DNA-binding transcriptional regulator [Lactiplantibacillus dongliensis]